MERGKPVMLSRAAQGGSPMSKRFVRIAERVAGRRGRRKRRPSCNGADRGSSFAPPERGADLQGTRNVSGRCGHPKPPGQTLIGSQFTMSRHRAISGFRIGVTDPVTALQANIGEDWCCRWRVQRSRPTLDRRDKQPRRIRVSQEALVHA